MGKKVNIIELAKYLNLSIATVSKALKDSYEISEQTKKKVIEAAQKLNYTPNPYASSLRRKKSKTIAVVLPEVADNFFSLAIDGIQSVADEKGYHVLIYLSHEKFSLEKTIIEECGSGRVDGVLISISSETNSIEHIQTLQAKNIPIVFFDREIETIATDKVITNDFETGFIAGEELIKSGCKNPVFLSISNSLPICNKRADGFLKALSTYNIKAKNISPVIYCLGDKSESTEQIKKVLNKKNKVDGIVASVERLAVQTYIVCKNNNIKIPTELKVIAFSTVDTAPIFDPPLSTIVQPAFDIGKRATEILLKRIEKPNNKINIELEILPANFIQRKSSMKK